VPAATATIHDVVIVGAGPAGLGVASTLKRIGVDATVVDRHGVGASFLRWPPDMRLITPSFTGNQFRLVDMNAITPDTSPALSLTEEHPTGAQYAAYLDMVAQLDAIDVLTGIDVTDVVPRDDGRLDVEVAGGDNIVARNVVWSAGEAQYPRRTGFPGAELGVPTVSITSWDEHPGDDIVIIGGYESGIDAAVNLIDRGRRVTVIDPDAPWDVVDADPSRTLSPYTHGRLRAAHDSDRLELIAGVSVDAVVADGGGWVVHTSDGQAHPTDGPPLLAIGFEGSLSIVRDRFKFDEHGRVELFEEDDGSTVVPGLYLAGPALAHREAIFCFIYKFRQRFAIVARAIGERLEVDTGPLEDLREHGFLLDDLSCCNDDCLC
jgi:putative flavoprotein involved in K+ transport